MKILANDGISAQGKEKLEKAGFTVTTEKVEQDKLIDTINKEGYVALLVRSATTVRKDLIDACPHLKFIGRGGVGMDNIDVDYAKSKGVVVENTPASSSQSVAELVMASMFSLVRTTYDAYRQMPKNGTTDFKHLKKMYGKGSELRGKTLLIIGFGRIGQSLASYALGVGMKVIAADLFVDEANIPIEIHGTETIHVKIVPEKDFHSQLSLADFISIHIPKPANGQAVIGKAEFEKMKDGVFLFNLARGGVIDESDLIEALNNRKVAGAAIDVFENEPTPRMDLLQNEYLISTPHIGAGTKEAQDRIGLELADKIIEAFK